jgi:hypothetical protein
VSKGDKHSNQGPKKDSSTKSPKTTAKGSPFGASIESLCDAQNPIPLFVKACLTHLKDYGKFIGASTFCIGLISHNQR